MLVCDRLQPLVFCLLPWNFHSDVAEPGISLGTMPMLYIGGDGDHHARTKADGLFSVFLIPTFSGCTDEELPSATFGAVDMPMIAAARLKRHIGKKNGAVLRFCQRIEIGLPDEVLCISIVGRSQAKHIV